MPDQIVKAKCCRCSGTGVYCGMAEPEGVAVVCLTCNGSGCEEISYTPFTERVRRTGVEEVRLSKGRNLMGGVGPTGTSISYEEFLAGKMPKPRV